MVRSTGITERGMELRADGQEPDRKRSRVGQAKVEHHDGDDRQIRTYLNSDDKSKGALTIVYLDKT
jgi:hypothetical protein